MIDSLWGKSLTPVGFNASIGIALVSENGSILFYGEDPIYRKYNETMPTEEGCIQEYAT
jgi:hypothetical protein